MATPWETIINNQLQLSISVKLYNTFRSKVYNLKEDQFVAQK